MIMMNPIVKTHMTGCMINFKSRVRTYTLVRTFYDTEGNIQIGNDACFKHILTRSLANECINNITIPNCF